jgi:predicted amidohydrolase YtcJ
MNLKKAEVNHLLCSILAYISTIRLPTMNKIISHLLLVSLFASCGTTEQYSADLVLFNGTVYTVAGQPLAEAVAVTDGTIVFVGSDVEVQGYIDDNTRQIDLKGRTLTPGFIESHGHFMGLGYNELELDLMYVKNYDELVDKVAAAVAETEPGTWITGRGWHQSKWEPAPEVTVSGFQTHDKLSAVSPNNPVLLRHASGHAAFANEKAMSIAGVNQLSVEQIQQSIEGGEIIRDGMGNPTGIFTETASGIFSKYIPPKTIEQDRKALGLAISAAQKNGITSFHDAGIGARTIELYQTFKDEGKLGTRLYVMLTGTQPELLDKWYVQGPLIDTARHFLTIRSIKLNCDGALGSRGAWLLEDYTDRPGHAGAATISMDYVGEVAKKGLEHGFQVCAHAIGDRANREVLDRYEAAFNTYPEVIDHRYRIEHAQHLHPDDIPRFAKLDVIAAMQAIHMSSDRPWAIDRLGEQRIIDGAYMWQSLLKSGAKVINGTDVPVEPINPLASFYASVTRKTLAGTPEGGYEPRERMTREQALRSYTLDAAYGEFEEDFKGSIEVGKAADFVLFSKDIMQVPEAEILDAEVVITIIDGKVVYQNENY